MSQTDMFGMTPNTETELVVGQDLKITFQPALDASPGWDDC